MADQRVKDFAYQILEAQLANGMSGAQNPTQQFVAAVPTPASMQQPQVMSYSDIEPEFYEKRLPMEGRATFLPFRDTMEGSVFNERELAVPGILAELMNAFTAPARSMTDPTFNAGEEAANMAMNVGGSGLAISRGMKAPTGQGGFNLGMNVVPESQIKDLITESKRLRSIYQDSPTQENMQKYLDVNEQAMLARENSAIAKAENRQPTTIQNEPSDYKGMHLAPTRDSGAPLSQLDQVYPQDIYSNKAMEYYGTGSPRDRMVFSKVQKFRNKPNADITIYRAVPKDLPEGTNINRGDWVTIDKQYAKDHGEGVFNGEYKIIEKKVKAKNIYTNADSIYEFGYDPD